SPRSSATTCLGVYLPASSNVPICAPSCEGDPWRPAPPSPASVTAGSGGAGGAASAGTDFVARWSDISIGSLLSGRAPASMVPAGDIGAPSPPSRTSARRRRNTLVAFYHQASSSLRLASLRHQQPLRVVEVGWAAGVLSRTHRPQVPHLQAGLGAHQPELPRGEARGPQVDLHLAATVLLHRRHLV